MIYRIGELFSGPGGLAMGASLASLEHEGCAWGFRHEWASDIDPDACATFRKNIPGASPESVICRDVNELDPERLAPIDCLAFGFPCNDYSMVGEQLGMAGRYGPLYRHGLRFLDHFKPKMFLAENVSGLASTDSGRILDKILLELESVGNGYAVFPHLYHAERYGVPQARHRILIVGFDRRLNVQFSPPVPTTPTPRTAREALESPPIPGWAKNQEHTKQSAQVIERLRHIRPGENAFNADLPSHLRLNVAGATISQIYRRLDPNKPAYTVTGSGGGGTHVYHWEEDRALTNRERARLQTFPDSYEFCGSKESVRKQIGMAVPVNLATVVFESMLKSLAGVEYAGIHPNIHLPQMSLAMERRLVNAYH